MIIYSNIPFISLYYFSSPSLGYVVQPSEVRQVITAERSKADAQQAQVEADSIRIEKEAKDWTYGGWESRMRVE